MQKVIAALIIKDGKILVARRKKPKVLENKWEFPGGKLEPGETPEQCLSRELFEELNIIAEIKEFIGSNIHEYKHGKVEILLYRAEYISGEFKLNEHKEIRWILPAEFGDYDFLDADVPIIENLMRKIKYAQ